MPSEVVGPASIVASQAFSAFSTFLPSFAEIRKSDPVRNPDVVGDVRMGEIAALTLSVGVGAILSSLTGSAVPAVVAVIMALILICLYEAALRGDKPGNPPKLVGVRERNDRA